MKDETIKLIKLINSNKTLNEISSITGLTNKQLFIKFSMLKQMGYSIAREYNYNGEINYALDNPFNIKPNNEITIKTPTNTKKIRAIITGDTHLGHMDDSIESAEIMTNYCIKEGIHNIFHAGDFFHGIYPGATKNIKISDPFEQIQYGLSNYPYDKSILTYICLGNHDASFWIEDGLDIKNILLERRHDLVPIGYGIGKINILNNSIYLHHPIERIGIVSSGQQNITRNIIIKGHSHKFKVDTGSAHATIYAPTLSTVNTNNIGYTTTIYPSMIDMELTINEFGITGIYLQHFMIINNQLIRVGEIENPCINVYHKQVKSENTCNIKPKLTTINTQENKKRILAKTPQDYKGMSQSEKFNTRYGK